MQKNVLHLHLYYSMKHEERFDFFQQGKHRWVALREVLLLCMLVHCRGLLGHLIRHPPVHFPAAMSQNVCCEHGLWQAMACLPLCYIIVLQEK